LHLDDDHLYIEAGVDENSIDRLATLAQEHTVFTDRHFFFGGVHAIDSGPRGVYGVGDPRRGGVGRAFKS